MKTLDLHGILHHKVEIMVEDFILLNETPLKIITGNSGGMISLVRQVVEKHGFSMEPESYYNLGAYFITEI
tara:strand:- start:4118 stop:4330 length:213 start_codon:yes stop_codon:yes gene_type:complete